MKIREFIPVGRNNAISMRELSEQLNISPRTTRAIIQKARADGEPICSDWENGGYYLPNDSTEAKTYLNQQRARIRSARAALNGVIEYIKDGDLNE